MDELVNRMVEHPVRIMCGCVSVYETVKCLKRFNCVFVQMHIIIDYEYDTTASGSHVAMK